MIKLSSHQNEILRKLLAWYKEASAKSGRGAFITLGGYAGTGKSTLIAHFRARIQNSHPGIKVAFCSYTGKATRVLREKLVGEGGITKKDSVSTIHSLIYSPIEKNNIIVGWELKGSVRVDLIIIDEASMVDQKIWQDLLSFGIPIIAVGDHGQLPPINGNFNLMSKPHLLLTEIHRQAKDNPIIQVSIFARKKGTIPHKKFSNTVAKFNENDPDSQNMLEDLLRGFSQDMLVLCGYNHTRVKLNRYIRGLLEIYDSQPIAGDRVVCLRNNHDQGILNGLMGVIQSIKPGKLEDHYDAEILMEDGILYLGKISRRQFNNPQSMNFTKDRPKIIHYDLFDFGYAVTVHKSQGGEADKVILIEERFKKMDNLEWRRWLYTAVTRAREELYIF